MEKRAWKDVDGSAISARRQDFGNDRGALRAWIVRDHRATARELPSHGVALLLEIEVAMTVVGAFAIDVIVDHTEQRFVGECLHGNVDDSPSGHVTVDRNYGTCALHFSTIPALIPLRDATWIALRRSVDRAISACQQDRNHGRTGTHSRRRRRTHHPRTTRFVFQRRGLQGLVDRQRRRSRRTRQRHERDSRICSTSSCPARTA